jgi:hypothetical protein
LNCDFELMHTRYYYNPEWGVRSEQAKEWARMHYWNVLKQIEVDLKAIK